MLEPSAVLYARAHWRIVRDGNCDKPDVFVVVDTAGIELRRESILDDAKAWIDRLVTEDHVPRVPARGPRR